MLADIKEQQAQLDCDRKQTALDRENAVCKQETLKQFNDQL